MINAAITERNAFPLQAPTSTRANASRMSRLQRLGRSFDFPKLCPLRSPPTAFSSTLKTPVPARQTRHSFPQCQRRPIQARCYNSAPPPSPPPLGLRTTNRLLYRADGTPRSKLTGLAIGISSLSLCRLHPNTQRHLSAPAFPFRFSGVASIATFSFLLYEALAVIDELDHGVHLLAALLHVQRADYRLFAATDLADPAHLLRLYRALQAPVNPALGDVYGEVDKMLTARNEKVCEEVGTVLREACKSVHDILHDPLEEVHELAVAAKIVDLLDQSCAELLEILRQRAETAEAAWDRGVREAGDSRPRTSAGEEYEVVG
ncbi:hypothetical protein BDN71DRAFT_541305 [Pleurotus eryngii]|uniref:Uncharacterized protein n=1 Tax=Pleurotus eryngii TaxID=5323 RepID=A0A9P5ZKR3_PLEER|nr:hypothetical protein BDN71DRAFT_541305 [Pleurotus eryngii]